MRLLSRFYQFYAMPTLLIFVISLTANAKELGWKGDLELGYVQNSGNTEKSSLHSGADLLYSQNSWDNRIIAKATNAESDGIRSAERYVLSNRYTSRLSDRDYLFVFAAREEDRFSGFDYQQTAAAGYGRKLLDRDEVQWDAEIGPGYRASKEDLSGDKQEDAIIRFFSKYQRKISESADITQKVSTETGDENTISEASTELKTRINGSLRLKISYAIKYTKEVPIGSKHADSETSVSLVYNF